MINYDGWALHSIIFSWDGTTLKATWMNVLGTTLLGIISNGARHTLTLGSKDPFVGVKNDRHRRWENRRGLTLCGALFVLSRHPHPR